MFYGVLALLQSVGEIPRKHQGAISSFDKRFVHTGLLAKDLSADLHRAFEARQAADYQSMEPVVAGSGGRRPRDRRAVSGCCAEVPCHRRRSPGRGVTPLRSWARQIRGAGKQEACLGPGPVSVRMPARRPSVAAYQHVRRWTPTVSSPGHGYFGCNG